MSFEINRNTAKDFYQYLDIKPPENEGFRQKFTRAVNRLWFSITHFSYIDNEAIDKQILAKPITTLHFETAKLGDAALKRMNRGTHHVFDFLLTKIRPEKILI